MSYRDMKLGSRPIGSDMTETVSPISITVRCQCGWQHTESRRQNALARASKMRAAIAKHECRRI
jgi:hypothetical protein